MDSAKSPYSFRLLAAGALLIALLLPGFARAVSIGEAVLLSKLGQPLHAQVDLTMGSDEQIDDSCLSLLGPDPQEEDISGYVTRAKLVLKTEGTRQFVDINSRSSLNDVFARLRLQVRCLGMGSTVRTLVILPDMEAPAPHAPVGAPVVLAAAEQLSSPSPQNSAGVTPDASRRDIQNVRPDGVDKPAKRARKSAPVVRATRNYTGPTFFQLKLSGDPIDESRIGKISKEERALLLAQQKLLDADDQMAGLLTLQNQVKLLQSELGEVKLQLAHLGASPATMGSLAATGASGVLARSAEKQPAVTQETPYLENGLLLVLGLLLSILVVWQGLRYYGKRKSRAETDAPQQMSPLTISTPISQRGEQASAVSAAPPASEVKEAAPPAAADEEDLSDIDAMLEEAGLYAAHGRPAKAVEILQEIIKRCPSKVEAWPLLLSIYSALGKATEFERTARNFLEHHPDSSSWSGIQALGRTFDKSNPLYTDHNDGISGASTLPEYLNLHRPIGDVLMEMGALSAEELKNCLVAFDPKKHGRFGGYLVARKAITLAQLDQALLQQQGVVDEAKPGALPSLQEMESFLADFDPKRDGSVAEFLASRQAVTPDQIGKLVQQHSTQSEAAEAAPIAEQKMLVPEFVLDFPPIAEVEPKAGKEEVLDPDFEPSPPPRSY